MGRKHKPAKLRLLEGNPGKRRIPKETQPGLGVGIECPETLNDVARAEWNRLREDMVAKGVLTGWDRATMAAYCQSYADWLEAQTKVILLGQVVKAPHSGTPMQNPYLSIARGAKVDMLKFAAELGLTPVSRARIAAFEDGGQTAGDVPPDLMDASGG